MNLKKEYIAKQQFMLRQPNYPKEVLTDSYFFALANHLVAKAIEKNMLKGGWPKDALPRMALCLIGYFQDVLADAGPWRVFIDENKRLYDHWLPCYKTDDGYMPYELNREDVMFLTWYSAVMNVEDRRFTDPFDSALMEVAELWFEILDREYDEAPEPEDYNIARGLEINNPEEQREVWHLSQWLFLHCYLITPAFSLTLSDILSDPAFVSDDDITKLHDRLDKCMSEDPTGPLALYLREWIYLLLEGKIPDEGNMPQLEGRPESRYYERFTSYTDGKEICFFGSYDELNAFLIKALGWSEGERHLEQFSNSSDFILMVNKDKGMLLARNICKCIDYPDNPYYDKEYARTHAFELISVRGRCPGDLLKYLISVDALPDARFPGTEDNKLVGRNADFLARLYLQQYYRGD